MKYPRKSHRKFVNIPRKSKNLAEFIGIEFGDGGINNLWQTKISLNAEKDLAYEQYVCSLIKKLFHISPTVIARTNEKTRIIVCTSISLVGYLIKLGCVAGNKVNQQPGIPEWIKENPTYEKAFVKGLVDTDGCLYIHKHKIKGILYQNIGFCFTNHLKKVIMAVAEILRKNGIKAYVKAKGTRIYIYNHKDIEKYLSLIGTSNPRILHPYTTWRDGRVAEGARLESV